MCYQNWHPCLAQNACNFVKILKKYFGKKNWNLLNKWKFSIFECAISVVMGSHKIFQVFENLIHLLFFSEFKMWKVGRMHSYESGERKKGGHLDFGMKQKWVIKVACKKSIDTQTKNILIVHKQRCFQASCIGPTPGSSCTKTKALHHLIQLLFSKMMKKIGQQNFTLRVLH